MPNPDPFGNMLRLLILVVVLLNAVVLSNADASGASSDRPLNIAHRGASADAPEHTLAAYELAIEQGADFVEQDLQVTRDGVLVCVHDAELSRTTNVREVFPDRTREGDPYGEGKPVRGWFVVDFTLDEIKRLDAGSWFNRANPFAAKDQYVGQRIPTLEEAIDLIGDRAGLYIEMKYDGFYRSMGIDMVPLLAAVLDRKGYSRLERAERVFIQCFSKNGLLRLQRAAPQYRRIQLLPKEDGGRAESERVTVALARDIAGYAYGVGPNKRMLRTRDDVAVFHRAGLKVHPYTFRGPTTAGLRQPLDQPVAGGKSLRQAVIDEIRAYIGLGIDGGFTDYPELWGRASDSRPGK